jgi:surface protein
VVIVVKRKGFTLIELLTIICILGVIILIAVPNITKLVAETKKKIFDTSSTNLIKTMEEECKSNLITKDRTTLSYSIINGKIDSNLDVKGTIPDDGYVTLDNKCNVKDYYLKYEDYVFSNGEDMRNDYMLAATTEEGLSVFRTLYSDYYDNIVNIHFVDNMTIPEGALEVKDPSVSGDGKIKSWLIQDGTKYNLYVGSEKTIFGNYDSSFLFYQMPVTNINLENFNTIFVENINYMFGNCFFLQNVDVSKFNTTNVTTMIAVFLSCNVLQSLDLTNWDTRNVTSMNHMFCNAFYLKHLDLSTWNTKNVVDMQYMFAANNDDNTPMDLISLNLSNWDMSNVTNSDNMFKLTYYLHKITVPNNIVANKIAPLLILRSTEYPGTITIIGDKTDVDTTTLSSKNWNVA